MDATYDAELAVRLRAATKGMTYREMSTLTGVSDETARRYIIHGKPSAWFCAKICSERGLDLNWLLCGAGSMAKSQQRRRLLDDATTAELIRELAVRFEILIERINTLERQISSSNNQNSLLIEQKQTGSVKRENLLKGGAVTVTALTESTNRLSSH